MFFLVKQLNLKFFAFIQSLQTLFIITLIRCKIFSPKISSKTNGRYEENDFWRCKLWNGLIVIIRLTRFIFSQKFPQKFWKMLKTRKFSFIGKNFEMNYFCPFCNFQDLTFKWTIFLIGSQQLSWINFRTNQLPKKFFGPFSSVTIFKKKIMVPNFIFTLCKILFSKFFDFSQI